MMPATDRPAPVIYSAGDRLLALTAAHAAFRRDLARLARMATSAELRDPPRRESITNGWTLFKCMLELHHAAEDRYIWPRLRRRLARSAAARSTLDEMDAEHARIDPLLAAVDDAFARPDADVAAVLDELTVQLSRHMSHEERDAMPMIKAALSFGEWQTVVGEIHGLVTSAGTLTVGDFLPWLTDGTTARQEKTITTIVPPPVRLVYRWVWKPRYAKASRW